MARKPSSTGLPEMWVPLDVVKGLNHLLPDDLMCYLTAIDMANNATGIIDHWVHTHVARRAGCSERVAAAAFDRLLKQKLITLDTGPGAKRQRRVHVRVGIGKSCRRLPNAALWAGPKDDGPRWGAVSGDAARALLALLNVMPFEAPTMTLPHKKVAESVGLASSVYRRGFTLLAQEYWVDVHVRWLRAGDPHGPLVGVVRDSNRVTLRWDVLAAEVTSEVADRTELLALAFAQKAHLEAVKSGFVSTEHVENAAGGHAENAAGGHAENEARGGGENAASGHGENTAGINTFSCQQVLLSTNSDDDTSSSTASIQPPPTIDHTTKEEEVSNSQENQKPKLTRLPAPTLTVADVLNAKSRQDAAVLIRAAVNRAGGGWRSLDDKPWLAATVAAIRHAPDGHALPITEADARQLTTHLLAKKTEGYTPLALAQQLVGASLNTGVTSVVGILRYRLTNWPDGVSHGTDLDPNDLLTDEFMIPAKFAREARGQHPSAASSLYPHEVAGRDRDDGSTYATSFY